MDILHLPHIILLKHILGFQLNFVVLHKWEKTFTHCQIIKALAVQFPLAIGRAHFCIFFFSTSNPCCSE